VRLLEKLSIAPKFDDAPRFMLTRIDEQRGEDLLREAGIDRRPFVAVHAGSAKTILAAAKRWPAEKYAALIEALRGETGWDIAMLEGPDERGVAEEILQAGGFSPGSTFESETHETDKDRSGAKAPGLNGIHVTRLTGPLGDAAAVLARAKLYVGTDSGLAHLASAVGTRAVTLFAPADPDRVAPFGNRDLVVKPDKPCSPCFLYPWEATKPKMRCRPPYCVREISVEMVMEKVRVALHDSLARYSGRGVG
jgi:ADP-heptose:LPS heptosyltransferase